MRFLSSAAKLGRRSSLNITKNLHRRSYYGYNDRRIIYRSQPSLVPYPIPLDPSSPLLPRPPESKSKLDCRPSALIFRVQFMLKLSDLDGAAEHARLVAFNRIPLAATIGTCNVVLGAMCRVKRYKDAFALFHYFFNECDIGPNTQSFNHIIGALFDEGLVDEALRLFRHISRHQLGWPLPDARTCGILTKGMVDAGRINEAVDLLGSEFRYANPGVSMKKHGYVDYEAYNNVIRGFLDLGDLGKANEALEGLKRMCEFEDDDEGGIDSVWWKDYNSIVYVNVTFMEYWFKQGKEEEAMECYRASFAKKKLRLRDETRETLLQVLLRYGKNAEAWALFDRMVAECTENNKKLMSSGAINIMVNECFKLGKLDDAIGAAKKATPAVDDWVGCYNNIIPKLCEHGMLPEASSFYEEMCSHYSAYLVPGFGGTHAAMVDAYVKAGRTDDALQTINTTADMYLSQLTHSLLFQFRVLVRELTPNPRLQRW